MKESRNAKEHSSGAERWLISYADFITLLFACFVVLYASSNADQKRMAQLAAAIHGGFQELGAFSGRPIVLPPLPVSTTVSTAGSTNNNDNHGAPSPPARYGNSKMVGVDVEKLQKELEHALGEEIKKREVVVRMTPEGLVISLKEVGFFDSGNAHLMPGATEKIARIARVLLEHGLEIRVEGHTDDKPIHTAAYPSNWELSTARATEVVRLLVEKDQFDPRKVGVAGYAEFRPAADNGSVEGRQMNRRVDLVILSSPDNPTPHNGEAQPLVPGNASRAPVVSPTTLSELGVAPGTRRR